MSRWTAADIPDQSGRRAIVTGANSGIGLETAAALAAHGAAVTLAVRDADRGGRAADEIRRRHRDATVDVQALDLADLSSVRAFADGQEDPVDLLVNNAGVMAIPRRETADGFEMQLGTNHLGHFALTGLLLPRLAQRPGARVVSVASGAHRMGRMNFDDLMGERSYRSWSAYGQSKLANLLFTFELQRRLDAAGLPVAALAAHPGYAATNLQAVGPQMSGNRLQERAMGLLNRVVAQSPAMGALPTLYAATAAGLPGGSYVGPDGIGEMRGHPRLVSASSAATDPVAAQRLWTESERLTGVSYDLAART